MLGMPFFEAPQLMEPTLKSELPPFYNMLYTIPYQLAGPSKHIQVGAAIGHNIRKICIPSYLAIERLLSQHLAKIKSWNISDPLNAVV